MKIDWKKKLTSRKFWVAVTEFISMIMIAAGATQSQTTQVVAIIMAGAGAIAYVIAEGWADANNKTQEVSDELS